MNSLNVGPLRVTFHRTIRVKDGQISDLPPSLGRMQFYHVKEFRGTTPETWDDEAVFIPLHENEALWLDFQGDSTPVAVLVGAGGVNALTGEKLGLVLESENYLTVPPQPWLDGWKGEDGTVYQFIATEYRKGEGKSVAEQLIGKESKTGGIGLAVFEAKDPSTFAKFHRPSEKMLSLCGMASPQLEACVAASCDDADEEWDYEEAAGGSRMLRNKAVEMGVGKGGKITQKIYPDPYGGIDTWKSEPIAAVAVYLVNAQQFTEITGQPMPPLPRSAEDYMGKWYGLDDDEMDDVKGSGKFTGLKTVFTDNTLVSEKFS